MVGNVHNELIEANNVKKDYIMSAFLNIVRNVAANELKKGMTAQGRDGVMRTVKVVKASPKANGANAYVVGFAGGRVDSFDAYEMVKTQ